MAEQSYLALCQAAHRYLRSGNAPGGSQPVGIPVSTPQDQVVYDIVDVMPRAWEWVQDEHPSWDFMRKQGLFVLTTGQRSYTLAQLQVAIADYYGFIPMWAGSDFPYFYLYDSGADTPLDYPYPFVEYQEWRGLWDRRPRPANSQPTRITELPNKTLELDPTPAVAPSGAPWAIKFDYRIKNQVLALNTDSPILPPEFQDMIWWKAIQMICESRMNTGPLLDASTQQVESYMEKLKARYLPRMQVSMGYA